MENLHLVYHSKAIDDLGHDDLAKILSTARRENLKNGISGFLVYRDNYFFQLLEGREDKVLETLARINVDPRHNSLAVIGKYKDTSLLMPNWSMALVDSQRAATSANSLIDLFDSARGKEIFTTKEPIEIIFKKFAKDAQIFLD